MRVNVDVNFFYRGMRHRHCQRESSCHFVGVTRRIQLRHLQHFNSVRRVYRHVARAVGALGVRGGGVIDLTNQCGDKTSCRKQLTKYWTRFSAKLWEQKSRSLYVPRNRCYWARTSHEQTYFLSPTNYANQRVGVMNDGAQNASNLVRPTHLVTPTRKCDSVRGSTRWLTPVVT